jgi:hypothetical protein
MKKLVFLTFLIILLRISLFAQYTEGLYFELIEGQDAYEVSKGTATDANVVIPSVYEGFPVVRIKGSANSGVGAFASYEELTSIDLPSSLTSIGDYAFYGCHNLENIIIPNSVASIGSNAFNYCVILKSIIIPEGVTSIEDNTFYNCMSLENIVLPSTLTSIGDSAFYYCLSLKNMTFPEGLLTIGNNSFDTCKEIENLTIPNSVTSIGNGAFRNSTGLKKVSLPSELDNIAANLFEYCIGLETIVIPEGVMIIGGNAFANCNSLESVTINENLISIGDYAFTNNFKLSAIYIPLSVFRIGNRAFNGCPILTIFTESATPLPAWNANWNYSSCPVIWGASEISTQGLQFDLIPGEDAYEVSRGVVSMGYITIPNYHQGLPVVRIKEGTNFTDGAFTTINITGIIIPRNIVSIGAYAFSGSVFLKNVSIHDNVSIIGDNAFEYCSLLENIDIPKGATSIGVGSFQHCSALTRIEFPETLLTIGDNAFSDCSSLNSVIIQEGLTSIGANAFNNCSSLPFIYIPLSVEIIGASAFGSCNDLTIYAAHNDEFNLPTNWDIDWNIDDCPVVWGASGMPTPGLLYELIVGQDAYEVSKGTATSPNVIVASIFKGFPVVRIKDSDNSVYGAFANYIKLTSIDLPSSITSIGDFAFWGCTILESIEISENVSAIGAFSFAKCIAFTEIIIPESVMTMGEDVFYNCALTIYVVADTIPDGWNAHWNYSDSPVVLGCFTKKPPLNLSANVNGNDVVLSWDAIAIYPAIFDGYKVYRDETILLTEYTIETTEYTDFALPIGEYKYHIAAVYLDGTEVLSDSIIVSFTSESDNVFALNTGLIGNYPNPFNPSTTIQLGMRNAECGKIEIFNVKGQKVKTLFNGYLEAGEHSFVWNGDDDNGHSVSSGIYFYKMSSGEYSSVKKMMLLK